MLRETTARTKANPRRYRLFGPVFLAALSFSACADNPESMRTDGSGSGRDDAAPGREVDRPHALTATRLLSVGDHTDGVEFFRLGEIVLQEDGGMVVADAGSRSLLWIDNAGNVLYGAGRGGSGPGEFESITNLRSVREGVVAWDLGLRRMSYFSNTGRLIGVVRLESPGVWRLVGAMADGNLLFVSAPERDHVAQSIFLRLDDSGEERSRWAGPIVQRPVVSYVAAHPVYGTPVGTNRRDAACLPTTFIVMSAGEVLSVDTGAGAVTRHSETAPSVVIFRAGDRPQLTPDRRRRLSAKYSDAPPDTVASVFQRLSAYDGYLPTWINAIAGADGTLYLERAECGTSPELREYDVVDTASGLLLGRVGTPRESSSVRAVSRNLAVLVVVDSLGVSSLEVHEIGRD